MLRVGDDDDRDDGNEGGAGASEMVAKYKEFVASRERRASSLDWWHQRSDGERQVPRRRKLHLEMRMNMQTALKDGTVADCSGHDAIVRINKVLRDHFGSRTKVKVSWVQEIQMYRLSWEELKPKAHEAFVEIARAYGIEEECGIIHWKDWNDLRWRLSVVADLLEWRVRLAKEEAAFKARMAVKDARIQKVNKGWKDWETYLADEQAKEKVAREVANEILARTSAKHIDIKKLTSALRRRLRGTMEAASFLGVSRGSFLRLRRKYGIEPVYVETVYQKDVQGKNVRCNKSLYYSDAQLQRIPGEECAKARHRSEAAQLRKRRSGIEQAVSRRRELIAC